MRVKVVRSKNLASECRMVQGWGLICCQACTLCAKRRILVCLVIESEEIDLKGVVNDGFFCPLCGGLRPTVLL